MLTKFISTGDRWLLSGLMRLAAGVAITLFFVESSFAHDEAEGGAGFLVGLLHPALGFDHLLAMLSVGILSVQIGRGAIWHVPTTFVLFMILGGFLGMKNLGIPMVEAGIAVSVMVLGVTLLANGLIPEWAAIVVVALFGVFHGHAHGNEMPLIANPWLYGIGFVTGTALIHLSGVLMGFGFKRVKDNSGLLRVTGLGIASAGCYFLLTL